MSKKISIGVNDGGIGNEPFYKSRRLWGALMCAVAAGAVYLGYPEVGEILIVIAGIFGITSWAKPSGLLIKK